MNGTYWQVTITPPNAPQIIARYGSESKAQNFADDYFYGLDTSEARETEAVIERVALEHLFG